MNESSKRSRSRIALLAGAVFLSACAGENLFSLTGVTGGGPEITITQPAENATTNAGDAVTIQATITGSVGLASVDFGGWYADDGVAAFSPESQTLNGVASTNVSQVLTAVTAQDAGDVYLVVEATDQGGGTAADSVKITIN